MRILLAAWVASVTLILAGCGGGSASGAADPAAQGGALSGNWQLVLKEGVPKNPPQLSVSGFLLQSQNSFQGSVELPGDGASGQQNCAGVGTVSGTLNGQQVTFSINEGGSTLTFSGVMASDGSMSGDYEGPGGSCLAKATTGTWSAVQVPPLNGSFSGMITNSSYMALATGLSTDQIPPIPVTATFTQSSNIGASNATISGMLNASNYPCFSSAYVTGTISGSNVVLSVFGFDGTLIGTLGTSVVPATVTGTSGNLSLTTVTPASLFLGAVLPGGTEQGPCPKLFDAAGNPVQFDSAAFSVTQN